MNPNDSSLYVLMQQFDSEYNDEYIMILLDFSAFFLDRLNTALVLE